MSWHYTIANRWIPKFLLSHSVSKVIDSNSIALESVDCTISSSCVDVRVIQSVGNRRFRPAVSDY